MKLIKFAILALISQAAMAQNADRHFLSAAKNGNALEIGTNDGRYIIRPYSAAVVETTFIPKGEVADAVSHAVVLPPAVVASTLREERGVLEFATSGITVRIEKQPFRISYLYKGQPLVAEKRGYRHEGSMEAIEFALDGDEALYGAGARATGMNRRGNRFQLYNRAHYGYEAHSQLLNFTIPMALSSKKYAIHFDNPQIGYLDFDSRKDGTLSYETIGGRKTYQVIAGEQWEDVVASYTSLTGRQPLPPRWTFGNFASRFGYHTEAETRAVVDKFIAEKIPLDAVVLDLYWFGKTVKATMGNLAWDKDSFPDPKGMMADLAAKGVKTVVITEPFVLTTSSRWQEAVERKVLATDTAGEPFKYDFYFGNTGLVDLYRPEGRDWFWNIYKELKEGGVAGWWGDLGEPEVHPSALRHGSSGQLGADQVHNIYGHDWARLIAEGYKKDFPNERPFILMRAGYSGSQRFGMIPWSGDVQRSWGGLQSQMEIALQMGMQGLAYMHSDLGGFASPMLDDELYVRWLQYGVFQPVFRPHAQEEVPAEPVFRAERTKALAREAIRLRYAMLPYNYSAAFDNSQTGLPLMRPIMFEGGDNGVASTYLWGRDLLVAPVTEPGAQRKEVNFPASAKVWFDFYTGAAHKGGINEVVPVVAEHIPVFVRAGAFVPMAKVVQTTRDYNTRQVELNYYYDASAGVTSGKLYDDDGATASAYEQGKYEIAHFAGAASASGFEIGIETEVGKAWQPVSRAYALKVRNVASRPRSVKLDGKPIDSHWDARSHTLQVALPTRSAMKAKLVVIL
ncbi:glycosyl hydrolase [Duganella sp. Root1480D1]|nr:glycosyl hydrolase [Duganella sp. Root1480D1]